ncbi:LuxR family transcriptional regulator [Gemmatirosa kalamazoonensis]|uniref:LuxR family transcriptional regulator n=1 Tax=Gemmatirosa kalamazoonensis TaxID=861299 RepID=W0RG39_9BACT|nr:GIY-YIG nuclease family protein [Gemmatirosa kalamazoonensis]AHG89402.1 LuxR family transcriptional regulator [Gemmatirosa kalamazoonensis]
MTRKDLVRRYKETRRPMGVYRVRNLRDGRSLVGQSVDLPSVLNRERTQLTFGGHRNEALQRDWNALGPDAFAFEILDTLEVPEGKPEYDPADDLRVLLALWLERLEPYDERGYMRRPRVPGERR